MKSLGLRLGRWTLCDNFLSYAQPSEGESEDEVAFSTEPRERKPVWTDEDDDKIRYIHVSITWHYITVCITAQLYIVVIYTSLIQC